MTMAENTTRTAYTVESLLAVTVEVFNERGYDGTSMEDLSKAAGISKSSIYHHVRGKEELLRLAVGRALDALFAILDEPSATTGEPVDRLEHVVRRTTEVLLTELPYVTLLLRVRGNTTTEEWALERRRDFDHRVAELVRDAVTEGQLRADVEPRLATRLLFGMINSIVEWYRPGSKAPDGVADAVVHLAFDGLRAR
ncbi:TetR/AcrR family transcriptional regulator [Kitasatospora sp. NPDC048365]|uniref:TetR/AcrR family transcriptional regulator n=1 Tax=Kitasatospora sp. NPDC048365 TaxID=3364050 RepID=UPI003721FED7